jgi:hypothetical protein
MSFFSLACLTASCLPAVYGFYGLALGACVALPIITIFAWQLAGRFAANIQNRAELSLSIWNSIIEVYPQLNTWRSFVKQFAHSLCVTAFITSSFTAFLTGSWLISVGAYSLGSLAVANFIQSYIFQIVQHGHFLVFPWMGLQIATGAAVIWKSIRITKNVKDRLIEMSAGTDHKNAFHALDGLTSLAQRDGDLAQANAYSIKLLDLASCA